MKSEKPESLPPDTSSIQAGLSRDASGPHSASESLPDERGQRTRDRVLLYVRGMDIPPLRSLAFAAESLGRSGPTASQAEAMRSLREVLREEGRLEGRRYGLEDGEEGKLDSAPPMNRRPMIAEKLVAGRGSPLSDVCSPAVLPIRKTARPCVSGGSVPAQGEKSHD